MPTMPLLTIVQMDRVKVMISFPENRFRYMKPGTPAQIRVAGYSEEAFEGNIDKVSPTLNPQTRLFSAEIGIRNEKHLLRPGMFATVTFSIDPRPDALLVPKEAILYRETEGKDKGTLGEKDNRSRYLFIVEGESVSLREVSTGYESDDSIEIREGVKKGEKVVTRGIHQLKEGDKVKIVN